MSRLGCSSTWWLAAVLAAVLVHDVAPASEARTPDGHGATYTVKAGDSLGAIAERQGVSLVLLRKVNGVTRDKIRPGQVLLLPTVHEVKPGDVLGTIAERYGMKLRELYRLNGRARAPAPQRSHGRVRA
jgi:LysM repeat protein